MTELIAAGFQPGFQLPGKSITGPGFYLFIFICLCPEGALNMYIVGFPKGAFTAQPIRN